jgi:3-oxo-5alpha-steroid 4-dehydrogenase
MTQSDDTSRRSTSPIAPRRRRDVGAWDVETDVVVAGYGCSGASAAIGAAADGAEVLVVERAGGHGGASAMAGGEIYLGGGTPIQKACGFDDTVEAMYAHLAGATGPAIDEARLSLYCERSVEHFDWLVSCGVPFKPSFYSTPCWEPPTDDGLVYCGGENAWPFSEIAHNSPRGHVPTMSDKRPGERSAGWMLMDRLSSTASGLGVHAAFDTKVERLVTEDDGRVVGVVVRRYGEEQTIRARRGVVLASGGFANNPAMVRQYAPALERHLALGTDGDDGTSIRLGQGVGAAVRHMDAAQAAISSTPGLLHKSILVNTHGQRFINEDTYAGRIGQAALFTQDGGRGFVVLDDEVYESLTIDDHWGARPNWVCGSVEELEQEMGLVAGTLAATMDLYNRYAEAGQGDPVFHKRAEYCKPLRAPFGAFDLREAPFQVFTIGGLHTTVDSEVIGPEGETIPGLYAAGRASSGIPNWGYLSGTSLGDGTFFGRRAGRAVAAHKVD